MRASFSSYTRADLEELLVKKHAVRPVASRADKKSKEPSSS